MSKKKSKSSLPLQVPKLSQPTTSWENPETNEENLPADNYEQELCWCIQQLELSLSNSKISTKQIDENKAIIKTLQNTKAPVVKKRMLMRKAFGDYRKKMDDEKQKLQKDIQKIIIAPAEVPSSSVYLKKATKATNLESTQYFFNFPDPN